MRRPGRTADREVRVPDVIATDHVRRPISATGRPTDARIRIDPSRSGRKRDPSRARQPAGPLKGPKQAKRATRRPHCKCCR